MKNVFLQIRISVILFSILLITEVSLAQTTVFSDNFETVFPGLKWTQAHPSGNVNWTLATGGPLHQPPQPQGVKCVRLAGSSAAVTDLITRQVDLSSYLSGQVVFWRNQIPNGNYTDELTVYCRTSSSMPWTKLEQTFATNGWTYKAITIPSNLLGARTQICFRGGCSGYGNGVWLDEISIIGNGGSKVTWVGGYNKDMTVCENYTNGCPASSDTMSTDIPSHIFGLFPSLFAGTTLRQKNLTLGVTFGIVNKSTNDIDTVTTMEIFGDMVLTGDMVVQFPSVLTIKPGGTLTVEGTITIISPSGMANSVLIVENNGSLITNCDVIYKPFNSSPYSGTGYPVIHRTIVQDLKWHLLSSPVVNQPIANKDFAPAPNTFLQVPNTEWDFYKFLTTCPDPPYDEHWRNLRNPDGTQNYLDFGYPSYFQVGKGYLVAYNDWHGSSQVFVNNLTKTFYGPLNSCCSEFHFNDEISECLSFWELIGNPFTSAIDWSLITDKSNLATDYYYIYNNNKPGGAGYEFWGDSIHHSAGADGYIPSMQGFFVDVLTNGGRFVGIPLSARVHHNATDNWLKETSANKLTVRLGNGTHYDETFVMFESSSNNGFDRYDAKKMFSMATEVPQVYSIVDNDIKTTLNSLPYTNIPITIPVGILAPADGNYSINVSGIENFSLLEKLSLEDTKLNYTQNLLQNPVYNFTASGNEDADRFLLHLTGPIGIGKKSNSAINIYSSEKTIFITCAEGFHNAQVTVSNCLGQEILSRKLDDQRVNHVDVNALKGYYIVKVRDEFSVKTTKVYIN